MADGDATLTGSLVAQVPGGHGALALFTLAHAHPGWLRPAEAFATPYPTPALTAPCAAFTANAPTISAMLTPTITLLKPIVEAFGTMIRSVHDVPMRGAAKASGPPLTVTLGLPIAADP